MGFWTTPEYKKLLKKLDKDIAQSAELEDILSRARVLMAIGKAQGAKADLDTYILKDQTNARVYVNRAATRFPHDLKGVVADCSKAIALEPDNKNAYFLRGLAHYEQGNKQQGCNDFSRAIALGFTVLRYAEQNKCAEFWGEKAYP